MVDGLVRGRFGGSSSFGTVTMGCREEEGLSSLMVCCWLFRMCKTGVMVFVMAAVEETSTCSAEY